MPERILFARALSEVLDQEPSDREMLPAGSAATFRLPFPIWFLQSQQFRTTFVTAAILCLVVACALIGLTALRLSRRLRVAEQKQTSLEKERHELETELAREHGRSDALSIELSDARNDLELLKAQSPKSQVSSPGVVRLVLSEAEMSAGTAPKTWVIPSGANLVQIEVNLEKSDFRSYTVSLQTPSGQVLSAKSNLRPLSTKSGEAIVAAWPASIFEGREYTVLVTGLTRDGKVENVGTYELHVQKR